MSLLILWIIGHILYSFGAIYYVIVSIPSYFRGRTCYVINAAPSTDDIRELLRSKERDAIPLFKFQITTKGNEIPVVSRGIEAINALAAEPLFHDRVWIDIVTEDPSDKTTLMEHFPQSPVPLNYVVVPIEYTTPNGTLKKARALHYMIEQRREAAAKLASEVASETASKSAKKASVDSEQSYIVYLDSESVMEPVDFKRLVFTTIRDGKKITEGPIAYPLKWFEAKLISRQMEATRPWHCYHCHAVMSNPPPQHLHGSNLVVEEELALEFGWDFGNLDGQPLVAEDLVFGLMAYLKYGREVFGWHGAQLLEQPPLSVKDSVRQRIRWVTGIWQALAMLKNMDQYRSLSFRERMRIRGAITTRATLYSLGFLSAVFFFVFFGIWLVGLFTSFEYVDLQSTWIFLWSILLLIGLVTWLGSTQIGLTRIFERMEISRKSMVIERLKILVITPVAALVETSGAFYASTRWLLGFRKIDWIPTKK